MAPTQRSKDECCEPEIAEDKMDRDQESSILGEAWRNRSNEVNDHGNDGLANVC